MTTTAVTPSAMTHSAMIAEVRATTAVLRAAQTRTFLLAAEWADAHPDLDAPRPGAHRAECGYGCATSGGPVGSVDWSVGDFAGGCVEGCPGDPDGFGDPFIPAVDWKAAAPFGAAIGRTTTAGSLLIRDALITRHRLPKVWDRVVAGVVEPAKARMIAQAVLGRPRDVSAYIDQELAHIAHKIGPVALERKVDEAMLRLYPEQREAEQLEELDRRYVTLYERSINPLGIADLAIRGDWKDLHDFDQAVSRVAAVLAAQDQDRGWVPESLDVRRARAVGVLADPTTAAALLAEEPAPVPSKRIKLVLRITDTNLVGLDPVAHNETTRQAILDQAVREWCGRTDTHLVVLPVLDLDGHDHTAAYQPKAATLARAELIAGTCVFPYCTRPATGCDHDHVIPYDHTHGDHTHGDHTQPDHPPGSGGPSCDCNIAPLCRHHHRLKTHAGWRYTVLDTSLWLWSDPHGQQFLRDPEGTTDITDAPRDPAGPASSRAPSNDRWPAAP